MNLDNNLDNTNDKNIENNLEIATSNSLTKFISNFINELQDFLNTNELSSISNQLTDGFYTIDRIENDMAVCENRDTQKMTNVPINSLPSDIQEGTILKYHNNTFTIDQQQTETVRNSINEQFKKL